MKHELIGSVVTVDGQKYTVQSVGVELEDGTIYAHLASITDRTKQRNGFVPRQIATFIPLPSKENDGE